MNICEQRARAKLARIERAAGKRMPAGYLEALVDEERRAEVAAAVYDGRHYSPCAS